MQLLEGFCSWPWKLCSHHVLHRWGFPRPRGGVGFAPCCPWGRFCEQCEVPQPLHTKAIQFNMLFIDKVEAGVVRKGGGWGRKGAGRALLAASGWCFESIALRAPSQRSQVGLPGPSRICSQSVQHWPPSPEQGTALPVCPQLSLFQGWAENA